MNDKNDPVLVALVLVLLLVAVFDLYAWIMTLFT